MRLHLNRNDPLPHPMHANPISIFIAWCLTLLLMLSASPLHAQTATETDATLDAARLQIDGAQKAVQADAPDAELLRWRTTVLAAQAQASDIAIRLAPQFAAIEARLAELGTAAPGAKEDADIANQRAALAKARTALDGQIKLARLLAVEGTQVGDQILAFRRSQFQARLGERTSSILSRSFWAELRDDAPRDAARLTSLGNALAASAAATPWWATLTALVVAVVIWPLRTRAESVVMRVITARVPPARVRRSLYALAVVLLWALASGACVALARLVLDWADALPASQRELLDRIGGIVTFSGFVAGLAHALICAERPSWRLTVMPDAVAKRLRWFPLRLALISVMAWVAERLTVFVDASLAMAVAVNCVVALGLALTLGLSLTGAERVWRAELANDGALRRPLWLGIAAGTAWLVLAGCIVSLLAGYVAFGSFAVKQLLWSGVVLGALYLLASAIDDAFMTWLAARPNDEAAHMGAAAHAPAEAPVATSRARDQAAVLLSAITRLTLFLLAMMLLLAPFGEGPADLWRRSGELQQGLAVGEVQIRPGVVLQALGTLLLTLGAARLVRRWMNDRYLPTTSLDAGMRASASTLFRYAGVVTAVAVTMSAAGIGLERIAWVASALSVGIGFGLQAVVQNFVSGLILLAERPVKVGDWVSLGGVEGDIRRINVRATEIQMGDRSTVIVPNSEFITKVVRNVTLADPIGLVQLKLPVPLASDPQQVRALLLDAFAANDDVLDAPAPAVLLDGVDGGTMMFNATGFVPSPRMTGNVRSALLFDVLQRLKEAGITLASPPTMLLGMPATSTAPAVPSTPALPGTAS